MDSPEREIYRDPDLVRAEDPIDEDGLHNSQTASKMLSIFRQMEEKANKEDLPEGKYCCESKPFRFAPFAAKPSGARREHSNLTDQPDLTMVNPKLNQPFRFYIVILILYLEIKAGWSEG